VRGDYVTQLGGARLISSSSPGQLDYFGRQFLDSMPAGELESRLRLRRIRHRWRDVILALAGRPGRRPQFVTNGAFWSELRPLIPMRPQTFHMIDPPMPRIRVEPLGSRLRPREAIPSSMLSAPRFFCQSAVQRTGVHNCAMEVLSGLGRLSQMGRYESTTCSASASVRSPTRASGRVSGHVEGDVVVYKRGVAPH